MSQENINKELLTFEESVGNAQAFILDASASDYANVLLTLTSLEHWHAKRKEMPGTRDLKYLMSQLFDVYQRIKPKKG